MCPRFLPPLLAPLLRLLRPLNGEAELLGGPAGGVPEERQAGRAKLANVAAVQAGGGRDPYPGSRTPRSPLAWVVAPTPPYVHTSERTSHTR